MDGVDVDTASDIAIFSLQVIGTIAFAISGALVAGRRDMDWFGVVVLAVMVAVGGGSLRDLLLGQTPVFWVQSPWYVILAGITALLTIPLTRMQINYRNYLLLSDALGLAVFAVLGTERTLALGGNGFVAIIMGVTTGVFGGVLRDVLASRDPSILYGDIYALAALIGCTIFVLLRQIAINPLFVLWTSIGVIFILRLIAIYRDWSLPTFKLEKED
jgi:uncharacterized membrane protein YeiH